MSKFEKLLQKIKGLSNDIRFEELCKILDYYGYSISQPKSGSSHYIFRKKGKMPITIPKHQKIKTVYIKIIKDIIEEEENK